MNKNNTTGSRILLVEDERSLAIGLEFNLQAEGYQVDSAADGRKALEYFSQKKYDLIILDIMLPYVDGFEVAETIRENDAQMPILMLTARTDAKDRIHGLQTGADDYLTKPFHLQELLLRVRGMLKRKNWYQTAAHSQPVLRFGNNEIHFDNLSAKAGDQTIQLTAHEAMLLKYLSNNPNRVISREELLQEVWNISSEVETRTVDNFIARLRKYFEAEPTHPRHIKSIRGAGYLFAIDEKAKK